MEEKVSLYIKQPSQIQQDISTLRPRSLAAPVALPASNINYTSFSANWRPVFGATGYYLDVATDQYFTNFVTGYYNLNVGNITTLPVEGLTRATNYYYRLRAYNGIITGLQSNLIFVTTIGYLIYDIDGNPYSTIIIGNKELTIENLMVTRYSDNSPVANLIPDNAVDLLTGWSNIDFDIFTFDGRNITRAVEAESEIGHAETNNMVLLEGDTLYFNIDLTLVNGDIPRISLYKNGVLQSTTIITEGANTLYFNITESNNYTIRILTLAAGTEFSAECTITSVLNTGWTGNTTGAYCWYNNDIVNKALYGALYNWHATSKSIFNQWFLPSKDELNAMRTNLYLHGVGNFITGVDYWSSSESGIYGLKQYFGDGTQDIALKSSLLYVRACHSFTSYTVYSLRDVGPSGGWIFNITDNGGGSYTYLEAAYSEEDAYCAWSNIITSIGTTGTAIGTGQTNTTAILGQVGHTGSAAKLCSDITTGRNLVYFERNGIQEPGWHILTDAEWSDLVNEIGNNMNAGGKLKETGTLHWTPPNTSASDLYGFKALPGGIRRNSSGAFQDIQNIGNWWTATEENAQTAWSRYLLHTSGLIGRVNSNKNSGLSVRCIRDIIPPDTSTQYLTLTDPAPPKGIGVYRIGVRDHKLKYDEALTSIAFTGVEGTDWRTIKQVPPEE